MRYLNIIIVILMLFISSCEDNERIITIEGKVIDPNQDIELTNTEIDVYTKDASNGTVSYVFEHYKTIYSDTEGKFKIEIPFTYTLAYKLEFENSMYFGNTLEIQSEDIENDNYYEIVNMFPESYLNIHIENEFSYDENDKITYHIIDWNTSCDGCCPPGFHEYIGDDINETISCKVIGEIEYTIEYIVFKNGNSNAFQRIVNCPAFEQVFVEISF